MYNYIYFESDQDSISNLPPRILISTTHKIWVWIPNESIRSVNLDGLLAIDPNVNIFAFGLGGLTTYQGAKDKSHLHHNQTWYPETIIACTQSISKNLAEFGWSKIPSL